MSGTLPHRPLVLGIVGGVASGKSHIAREFARLGAGVLDADQAGHDVLLLPEVRQEIEKHFGKSVIQPNGELNRSEIAKQVFDPSPVGQRHLEALEHITHPRIAKMLEAEAARLAAQQVRVIVLDAAVMKKAGWDKRCDRILFVDAPPDVRLARARSRGWTKEEFERRERSQESLEDKKAGAHYVIHNGANDQSVREQIERIWQDLIRHRE